MSVTQSEANNFLKFKYLFLIYNWLENTFWIEKEWYVHKQKFGECVENSELCVSAWRGRTVAMSWGA